MPDGTVLGAWLFVPEGQGPFPAITMSHGFGGTRFHGLEPIARRISEAGFVVSVHDHRNFGSSTGTPRQDIDPYQQVEDWRRVIAHLATLEVVDSSRIGIWGTSFSGGHALVLGATDRMLKAVYAQVPTIDGYETSRRRVAPHLLGELDESFASDEVAQARGELPRRQFFVNADPAVSAAYRSQDAIDFYLQDLGGQHLWENTVTLQSSRRARSYIPGVWIDKISPTPLFLLIAEGDTITPADLALQAYERALHPKDFKLVAGGHFDPYTAGFETSTTAAIAFFNANL